MSEECVSVKHCLVVDDSAVIRKVARRILEGLEFRISEAEDGEQALTVCRSEMPDAILLDWNMPVMDGYEFLKQLRQMAGGGRPKVVFCTTENEPAIVGRGIAAGADGFVTKPFDDQTLSAKLQRIGAV